MVLLLKLHRLFLFNFFFVAKRQSMNRGIVAVKKTLTFFGYIYIYNVLKTQHVLVLEKVCPGNNST